MEDYIKIPKDFKSLHELKDLVNNYDLVTRLSEALNGYQQMYLESYLMTYDEVLKFIPESKHELYKNLNAIKADKVKAKRMII